MREKLQLALLTFTLKAIAIWPLRVLYVLSDLIYPLVYYIVGYRREVVRKNLESSFPEKSEKEIREIEKRFYRHFTVFYDLPEIKTTVSDKNRNVNLRLKINIELSSIDDLRVIEALSAKLVDSVIGHTIELRLDEIKGSTGLYWLKEEILYRLSLAASPVKIKNINFSLFEIEE